MIRMFTEFHKELPEHPKRYSQNSDGHSHWLPIKSRIAFRILFLTYKVLRRPAPTNLHPQAPLLWKQLPVQVWEAGSLSNLKID